MIVIIKIASVHYTDTRLCENGELEEESNILYICVSGTWRTLCPKLWRSPQAKVACRQLNPGKVVIGKAYYFIALHWAEYVL